MSQVRWSGILTEDQVGQEGPPSTEEILRTFTVDEQAELSQEVGLWLSGMTYNKAESRLGPPPTEFPKVDQVRAVLSLVVPGSETEPSAFRALLAMLRIAIDHPASFYALTRHVQGMMDYYRVEARGHTRLGLRAIADCQYEQIGGSTLFAPMLLQEIFHNLASYMREAGFFDRHSGSRKKVVVVNGRYRTGSTKVFGAVQSVLRFAEQPFVVRGTDFREVDDIITNFQHGAFAGKWVLIKTHNWMPREADPDIITVYTRRNLADVAASNKSLWHRSAAEGERPSREYSDSNDDQIVQELTLQKLLNEYIVPKMPLNVINYDEFQGNEARLVEHVSSLLGVSLDGDAIKAAARQIEPSFVKRTTDKMARDTEHEITLLRSQHISDTLGKKHTGLHHLSPNLVSYLKKLEEWPFA